MNATRRSKDGDPPLIDESTESGGVGQIQGVSLPVNSHRKNGRPQSASLGEGSNVLKLIVEKWFSTGKDNFLTTLKLEITE